jgi:SufS family cysteine desulfurase
MSIPKLDAPALPGGEEFADTALIARLANELYSGFQRSAIGGGSLGGTEGRPAADNGLAGAYPAETRQFAPPVHPASQTARRDSPATDSGGHAPGSTETYPFGEPRCAGGSRPNAAGQTAPAPEASGTKGGATDSVASPGYYFIQRAESVAPPGSPSFPPGSPPSPARFDVESIRRDFPALAQLVNGQPLVWLDNAATTHKPQSVLDATSRFYGRDNSNIHRGAHTLAARATDLFEEGREKVRRFIGAGDTKEIVFVRGTTEAINLVAQTYGRKNIGPGDEILLTTMEHHANIVPWQMLAEQTGAAIRVAPINDRGELIVEQFAALLGSRTKIVALAHVGNSLGTINPAGELISLAHAYGIPVLLDGAQSAPHMPINVQALDADFFTFSGHKVFGPTGIGVLYGKAKLLEEMPPWQGGGNMIRDVTFAKTSYQGIPAKFEAGTPDIAGVVGLGAAIDYLESVGLPGIAAYEHKLLEYATAALAPIKGLRFIGTALAKASVLSFVIDGVPTERIGKHLDQSGIAIRAGHHCAQPSLRRFGLESTARPSLAFYNTRGEVDALEKALRQIPRN